MRIAKDREEYNASRLGCTFPLELQLLTIDHLLATVEEPTTMLVIMASVSRHFRKMVVPRRALWSRIGLTTPDRLVTLALERSSPLPVNLASRMWFRTRSGGLIQSPHFKEVLQHRERYTSLELHVLWASLHLIPPVTSDSFPLLTTLVLECVASGPLIPTIPSIQLFGTPLPQIRRLKLGMVSTQIPTPMLQGLEDVCMWDTGFGTNNDGTGFSTNDAITLIDKARNLRAFALGGQVPVSPLPPPGPRITNTNVEEVVLGGAAVPIPLHILPYVDFPNCKSLFVDLGAEPLGIPSTSATHTLRFAMSHLLARSERPPRFMVRVWPKLFAVSLNAPHEHSVFGFTLQISLPSRSPAYEAWLSTALTYLQTDGNPIDPLQVHLMFDARTAGEGGHTFAPGLLDYLARTFCPPRSLTVICLNQPQLLDALCVPRTSQASGDQQLLFPRLQELVVGVRASEDLTPFVNMVRRRFATDLPHPPETNLRISLPTSMERFNWARELAKIPRVSCRYE